MLYSIYRSCGEPVEKICYDTSHVAEVLSVLKKNFGGYFDNFVKGKPKKFVALVNEAVEDFEKDRDAYKKIFNAEVLEEYEDDPNAFKSTALKNKCPVIRKTLQSSRDELKQYKISFKLADANELLEKVTNICAFGREYFSRYNAATYENAETYSDLGMEILDGDDCSLSGVIGVGIKSRILYKLYPAVFPNENQNSIWSLYFLSGQEEFGCERGSEFLMINDEDSVTRQNYSYPYRLFAYYALELYKLLEHEATKINLPLEKSYRYVVVNAFLSSVADKHEDDIKLFKQQIANGGAGYGWS